MIPFHKRELFTAAAFATAFLAASVAAIALAGRFAPALIAAGVVFVVVALGLFIARQIEERTKEARTLIEASVALYRAVDPIAPLPAMRDFTILPDSALLLHSLVSTRKPQLVVEIGSGVSSLVIGYALKSHGGRLIALERDAAHAERTRAEVAAHQLGEHVTIVDAPLTDVTVDGERFRWHDPRPLESVSGIDLVFDDGPPKDLGPRLRAAALPLLKPKLSERALYLINYVGDEERQNVASWLKRWPELEAQPFATKKGNILLRRRP